MPTYPFPVLRVTVDQPERAIAIAVIMVQKGQWFVVNPGVILPPQEWEITVRYETKGMLEKAFGEQFFTGRMTR